MSDKKVKISNILGSQIPDFIQADNPLFIEFLTQYYASEEREYGNSYLADHISSLKNIPTVSDISLVEKQTVNAPNTASPQSPVLVSSLTYAFDDEITVNQGEGFPDKYGLIKIDNEIITYTGKRKNLTNIGTNSGIIDTKYDMIISGITTTNIKVDDVVSLSSVKNTDKGDNIVVISGTRVSGIGTDDTITVDRPISGISTHNFLEPDNIVEGSFTFTRESFTFTGCVRGFSGISAIETVGTPEFLTFSDTNAAAHNANSSVINLSFLFVTQFYKKFRRNFLPGLEGRDFAYGLNVENILSRARDFYSSKGTDTSLRILFQVLYSQQVDIIKPFNQTIMPSEAQYDVSDNIIVEVLSGNPLNLVGVKIYQDSFTNPTASGAVSNINTKFLGNKKYYEISFSKGTIIDQLKVSTKTKVIGAASTTEVLTVDSTVGFGETGNFYYLNSNNSYTLAEYTSKSSNQFFGCTGVSRLLTESEPIIDSNFVYGYENNDLTKICAMRIVGTISGASDNKDSTKYFDFDDLIRVKHLGEKYDVSDKKFNTWFYNNISYIDVLGHVADGDTINDSAADRTFTTATEHFLKIGDRVDIFFKESGVKFRENSEVSIVNSDKEIQIDGGIINTKIISGDYVIKKRLNYTSSNFGITNLLSNIQNSFSDKDKNTYVSFSGYPSFDTQTTNRSHLFQSTGISTNTSTITINDHNFINGEKVYLSLALNSGLSEGSSGYYYVNVIDSNNFKLSTSYPNLYNNTFTTIKWSGIGSAEHTITPATLYTGQKLSNQNNLKRIYKNPQVSKNNSRIIGAIGISLNGVEYHSPISNESVYYGQIDQLQVTNSGENFDVINPPTLSITDNNGTNCETIVNFSGQPTKVILNKSGFDYLNTPSVRIVGGNGTGAVCEAKMRGFNYSRSYTDFNVNLTTNRITGDHRFSDGEEVRYIATGTPIGIAGTDGTVGFTTSRLTSGTSYFIAKYDDNSFGLAINENRALTKTNLLDLNDFGNQVHTFQSQKIRNIIDRIEITNTGSSYDNHRVEIQSQQYPPINLKDVFKTFVGINIFNDYIYAKNHNFKNGDIVDYVCSGTVISGLSTSIPYQITIIDDDKFKLSSAGTATTISNTNYERKIYEKLSGVGVGTHTFKYPDIQIEIDGQISAGTTSTIPNYYKASAEVEVRGGLKNIFVKNGGVGYGVTNIINYLRKPKISLLTGKNAFLTPNVINGKIESVSIGNGGSEYTSPPILEVVGVGETIGTTGAVAELRAVVTDGKITDVKIIEKGSRYNPNNTIIRITPSGSKSIITTKIHEWEINSVERYNHVLTENNSQFVQINSESLDYNNKICSFYPVKKYRRLLRDNINSNLVEFIDNHSKIVGWAYDGNPIYGPVGVNTAGITTYMQSSYQLDIISDSGLRPSTYQNGYFIQDYVYKGNGDLDEFNGTFLINPDFPEGTYAYFSTLNNTSKNPSFPYISFQHRNATDNFNYDLNSKQIDKVINSGEYKRNVTHLGLNDEFRRYPVLNDSLESKVLVKIDGVKDSKITKVNVDGSGTGYKVNDKIIFNDPSITSSVDQVIGKQIVSVGTTNTIINNLIFSVLDDQVTGFSTIPHGLSTGDIVEISGISSTLYKNIEGVQTIGVTTTTASLSQAIGNAGTTGVTTFISLSSPTLNRKFEVDDVFQIGSEQFLVLDHDDVNNKYRVRRGYNSSGNITHSAGAIVNKLETKFTYSISKKIKNINVKFPKIQYFEGVSSIGIGTTVSNVIVGQVGITSIFKSIPAKAIYLPNHKFENGDEVKLISIGSTINATRDANLSPVNSFDLSDFDKLFCTRFNSEFIGLATEKTGIGTLGISTTSQNVFFKEILTTGGDDNKLELLTDNVFGSLRKVNGTVTVATSGTTGQHHALSVDDEFELHLTTNKTQTFNLKYNESIQKLVVNPLSFIDSAIGIGTTISTITINDHDFQTGDLIVYNSTTPADPLVNDGVYYIIKESRDTIRLAENAYDLSIFPYNYIGIGTTGGTNHEISKINPKLSFYKNNTVELITTDSSLDDFSIEFYEDKNLKSKYNSNLITKTSDKITISVTDSLAQEFFYKIKGKKTNSFKTLSFPVDERVPNYSQIVLVESKFNDKFKVTGISSDTFKFNATGIAETTSYTSTGLSTSFYSTSSINEIGGIHSINVLNKGFNVRKLPLITSIGTTEGLNSVLTVEADDIGKIESTQVINQGLEFSPDNTLKPKADSNVLLKLKNVLTLDSIGITSGGINYTYPPSVLVIGKPNILAQTTVSGTSVDSVKILTNDSGLSEDVRIIPITNSNGVVVTGAETNSLGTVTLDLRAPNPDSGSESGFYNSGGDFPFAVNDEIFVENIKTTDNPNGGYNSSDYNYTYFKVTGIGSTGGAESVSYSIAGLGSTGGTYQEDNNFGRVIKKDNLAVFKAIFKETVFSDDEIVRIDGKNISGIVARNGWDPVSETLKVFSTNGDFSQNDKIVGSISNNKGTITKQFKFDFDLDVDSLANINNSWKTSIGKLNSDIQKLHDNDYYQRFSYSIKGEVPFNVWKDSVDSLGHIAGFKNFSNLGINTVGTQTIKSDAELVLDVDIDQEASVHEIYYYDMAVEDTDDSELSKLIVLKSKKRGIITDYNESRTNKVFLIDDISSQFTGIVTSIGGGVIGTTSFNVFADGNSLFHREFNPSTGVSTVTYKITLPKHNFNTGEELVYKPHSGQQPIGIANTSDVNAGVAATTLLPSTVFAIREDPDTIKVAISATFASAGIAVSFTNVVGIANTNTLSVPSENATIRSLITIDNIIQSPIGITTAISVGLTTEVGISTTIVFLNDTSEISGKSLFKIENEIIKVSIVGVGTTTLNVERGQMGTVAVAHTVGAAVTVLKGDYRINEGRLYFSEAPYGPTGTVGITTHSTFSGRAYYRLTYDTNKIIDDISDRFDGSTDQFKMTTNGNELLGISSSFGAVLINNIFQKPFFGDVGDINKSDYQIIGAGSSIDFTGTSANKDLPRGGIINEFDVGIGSGYQVPKKAILTAVVSAGGTIQSVGIASGGAGYLSNPLVSVSSTTGVGAAISAFVTAGIVTSVTITNPGSGYAQGGISTGINFVTTDLPSPYKNIPLSGGNGSGATMDVVVGTGGSILSFDIADRGVGYEIGDKLDLTTLPFQVGIGTSAFNITVKNKFQDKFAGWCFGQLLELDDFSIQFNGSRKSFLITRTVENKEYYSIVAQEGSGIILQNNLLIFLNDILQRPGIDYEFEGGTRITFREPPKPGSLFKMYLYTGSTSDFVEVDVDETIKPGDELRLHYFNQSNVNSSISSGIRTESVITLEKKSEQKNRVVYELIAADTVETTTYSGVGISTNSDFARPMMWRKQTQDLIIDGISISKERNYLEPDILPTSGIIKSISPTDSKIYVKDSWMFKKIDDLGQTLNNINIVGLGTTAVVETIEKVTYEGDYGVVVGIGTSAVGINTTKPALFFEIVPHENIYDPDGIPNGSVQDKRSKSGISTGDYFVIDNTFIGNGITGIRTTSSGPETVGVGNSFLNNVYFAEDYVSVGSSMIRVFANVNSIAGIDTTTLTTKFKYGTYSWGSINVSRSVNSKSFTFHNQNGVVGIETSAQVIRTIPIRTSYT